MSSRKQTAIRSNPERGGVALTGIRRAAVVLPAYEAFIIAFSVPVKTARQLGKLARARGAVLEVIFEIIWFK